MVSENIREGADELGARKTKRIQNQVGPG